MVMRVQRFGSELHVVLTPEAVETLKLEEGSEVVVRAAEAKYVGIEEGMKAYFDTLPLTVRLTPTWRSRWRVF